MKKVLGLMAVAGFAAAANAGIVIQASSVPFVDISVTGTSVGTTSDDSEHTVNGTTHNWVGNELFAGGMAIRVGNNGGIIWGTSAADTFTNADNVGYYNPGPLNTGTPAPQTSIAAMAPNNATTAISNGNGLRQLVAPLWDDYNSPVTGTSVKWQVIGADLIIQWTNEDHFAAAGTGTVTFQAIFRGGVTIASGQSLVDFVYQDTSFVAAGAYQNDGGSATIGYKNWGLNANANDVEFGIGGGGASATSDPTFASGTGMQPKVGGWAANNNAALPHSVSIIPTPGALALLGMGGLVASRRRRA